MPQFYILNNAKYFIYSQLLGKVMLFKSKLVNLYPFLSPSDTLGVKYVDTVKSFELRKIHITREE